MNDKILKDYRIAFCTLGCKVNAYESDAMMVLLKEAGAEIVDFDDTADVYIINTCSVTNIADRKSRQMISRAVKSGNGVVIATGCYVQAAKDDDLLRKTGVDALVGNNCKKDIVNIVYESINKKSFDGPVLHCTDIDHDKEYEEFALSERQGQTRAYLKIQDGCNQFCSYCIIPFARGRVRSRDVENAVCEAKKLAKLGYKELVLTGIHISSYQCNGLKVGDSLLFLLNELNKIDGIERIRLGSLEPRIVTREFAEGIAKLDKICPHFHLSLQSGSDTVLKRMNRKYTTEDYRNCCNELRRVYDNPSFTTDIIVGFPGETDEEFEETCEFAKEIGFSKIHVFKYSRRRGTVADKMPKQVPEDVKNKRSHRLIAIEEALGDTYRAGFIGKEQKILLEEIEVFDEKKYIIGYNERYVRCALPFGAGEAGTIAYAMESYQSEGVLFPDRTDAD